MPALAYESFGNLCDKLPPFHDDRSDEARHDFARGGEQPGYATTLVLDVEIERLGKEHHRASGRLALSAGKARSRLLEKEQASAAARRFTDHPEPALVAADIEQWNRLAECAGVRPSRQLGCRRHGKGPTRRRRFLAMAYIGQVHLTRPEFA